MSLSRMSADRIVRDADARKSAERPEGDGPPTPPRPDPAALKDGLAKITAKIPTEAIGVYLAFLGASAVLVIPRAADGTAGKLCEADFTSRWLLFWTFVFLGVPTMMTLIHAVRCRKSSQPFMWPLRDAGIAMVAFAAWALVLPETPLGDLCSYNAGWNSVIILVVAFVVGYVGDLIAPTTSA